MSSTSEVISHKNEDQEQMMMTRRRRYQIPKFDSILTYRHSHLDKQQPALMNEWMDWMFPFSLLPKSHFERRVREAGIMTASYFNPSCQDINRFEHLVKFMGYLFICDDHIELIRDKDATKRIVSETLDCVRRLEDIYVNGLGHSVSLLGFKPYILCAYFVVEDILLAMNIEQRKRFIEMWRSYCLDNDKENELIEGQLLDLDTMIEVRLESGAMKSAFALIEYANGIQISDDLWFDERIQRLMRLCNLCVVSVNDVYSFEKEYLEQNEDMAKMLMNVVGFHVLRDKCSIEEAMEKSLDFARKYELEYKELADSLANDPNLSDDCKNFVECVTLSNAGNVALSIHCNRYNVIYESK